MTRLLWTGDLHLGKGGAYGRVPGERLAEQEAVWASIVALAREGDVDAILFAGDAFEGPLPTPEHYAAFARPLRNAPCPVIAVSGNGRHDSAMRDTNALEVIGDLLALHTRPAIAKVADVSIACLPWAPVSRIVAAQNGGDRDDVNQLAAELLMETARGLRAEIEGPAILLTHFSISGASLPGGMTSDQLREPLLPLEELERLGFDAVVAGHLHPPALLASNPAEPQLPILYVGSPLPLDFGEGGYEHGCWLLDLDGPRGATVPQFLKIESRRFVTLDWDYGAAESLLDLDAGRGVGWSFGEGSFVKLRYSCTAEEARRLDAGALRQALLDAGAHNVWVEPTIERDVRARVEGLDESVSDTDALSLWLDAQEIPADRHDGLRTLHEGYLAGVIR